MDHNKVYWLFDLISPFAYLSLKQLPSLPEGTQVELVPVLLAGLLKHHGQLGPAEILSKRRFTYRFVLWRARKMGVALRMPPSHPFNPLPALRLLVAAGSELQAVGTAFDFVFGQGRDLADPHVLAELAAALHIPDGEAAINDPTVKQRLRDNTERAIARGVFGVPTFLVAEELFWGHDAFDMVVDYLRAPLRFQDPEMTLIDHLPVGVQRKREGRS
jgi:2-hydroxychromene-2-carboxylate isomerase